MDPLFRAFFFGFIGSVAVEVVYAIRLYEKERPFPGRYRQIGFWFLRFGLAVVGGTIALAYQASSDLLAMHLGASAPLIIDRFWQEPPKALARRS